MDFEKAGLQGEVCLVSQFLAFAFAFPFYAASSFSCTSASAATGWLEQVVGLFHVAKPEGLAQQDALPN
eukprot:6006248-Amphidinium_carterae.1